MAHFHNILNIFHASVVDFREPFLCPTTIFQSLSTTGKYFMAFPKLFNYIKFFYFSSIFFSHFHERADDLQLTRSDHLQLRTETEIFSPRFSCSSHFRAFNDVETRSKHEGEDSKVCISLTQPMCVSSSHARDQTFMKILVLDSVDASIGEKENLIRCFNVSQIN